MTRNSLNLRERNGKNVRSERSDEKNFNLKNEGKNCKNEENPMQSRKCQENSSNSRKLFFLRQYPNYRKNLIKFKIIK